jgi:putative ABC transport system ATP-binding protein
VAVAAAAGRVDNMTPVVAVRDLRKVYPLDGGEDVVALRGVDLTIEHGEFVAVMGPSGSGKSTFMHIVGLLDRPTSGTYSFTGRELTSLDADALADLRSRALGFVFQAYNLLPRTTAIENVELPMIYAGVPAAERKRAAMEALDAVGLAKFAQHQPNQLSGGQQQRVAIARSIVNNPQLILADEPTGALDTASSEDVMKLFQRLNAERGMTVMLVTHEPDVAAHARRLVSFRDGRIVSDEPVREKVLV